LFSANIFGQKFTRKSIIYQPLLK